MPAFSRSKLWGAINFTYLTSLTRKKKLCILSLWLINSRSSDACSPFHCVLHTCSQILFHGTPLWFLACLHGSVLEKLLNLYWVCGVPYGFSRKREQLEKYFSHAAPKHTRSAERWLFLPPPSQRFSGNFILQESSMRSLAVAESFVHTL